MPVSIRSCQVPHFSPKTSKFCMRIQAAYYCVLAHCQNTYSCLTYVCQRICISQVPFCPLPYLKQPQVAPKDHSLLLISAAFPFHPYDVYGILLGLRLHAPIFLRRILSILRKVGRVIFDFLFSQISRNIDGEETLEMRCRVGADSIFQKTLNQSWGYKSVVEHLSRIYMTLGSISSTTSLPKQTR